MQLGRRYMKARITGLLFLLSSPFLFVANTHAFMLVGASYNGCLAFNNPPVVIRDQLYSQSRVNCASSTYKDTIQRVRVQHNSEKRNFFSGELAYHYSVNPVRDVYLLSGNNYVFHAGIRRECNNTGFAFQYEQKVATTVEPWGANGNHDYFDGSGLMGSSRTGRFLRCDSAERDPHSQL